MVSHLSFCLVVQVHIYSNLLILHLTSSSTTCRCAYFLSYFSITSFIDIWTSYFFLLQVVFCCLLFLTSYFLLQILVIGIITHHAQHVFDQTCAASTLLVVYLESMNICCYVTKKSWSTKNMNLYCYVMKKIMMKWIFPVRAST